MRRSVVSSEVQSAAALVNAGRALEVPSYQRPYVWPQDAVTLLLQNIVTAYDARDENFYIGTVLSCLLPGTDAQSPPTYELIDGQQRMTTLVLLALALGRTLPDHVLSGFAVLDGAPRLRFAIRSTVQTLLGHWVGLDGYKYPGDSVVAADPYLTHLSSALRTLDSELNVLRGQKADGDAYLSGLGLYIFHQVLWVNNIMPAGTDLNRLFATANTTGVQLEQSDILKSRLLGILKSNHALYEAIWQACEGMGNYFERNLRQLFPLARWHKMHYRDLAEYSAELFPFRDTGRVDASASAMSIAELARGIVPNPGSAGAEELATLPGATRLGTGEDIDGNDNAAYCKPVISFALLLMHALRIYLNKRGAKGEDIAVRMNENRLNEAFEALVAEKDENEVCAFMQCLWQVRFQFDTWVVKWVGSHEDDRDRLQLTQVILTGSGNDARLSRTVKATSNLLQLQCVRNFTGERSAQYWLTPFLGRLIGRRLATEREVTALLEQVDNQMSLAKDTQKQASFAMLSGAPVSLLPLDGVLRYLAQPHGTEFEHYWFQKIEYLLWRARERFAWFDSGRLAQYRITSRNSVEHVNPQNPRYGEPLEDGLLHGFGNLVLLSPGENSAYSDKDVREKWAGFQAKPVYDSLKLAHLFAPLENGKWSTDLIVLHQEVMLAMIRQHYTEGEAMAPEPNDRSTNGKQRPHIPWSNA